MATSPHWDLPSCLSPATAWCFFHVTSCQGSAGHSAGWWSEKTRCSLSMYRRPAGRPSSSPGPQTSIVHAHFSSCPELPTDTGEHSARLRPAPGRGSSWQSETSSQEASKKTAMCTWALEILFMLSSADAAMSLQGMCHWRCAAEEGTLSMSQRTPSG